MHCKNPIRIKNPYTNEYMFVPCGKCEGCLIEKANNLSRRVSTEISNHPYNLFFTLTYDNFHIPYICKNDDGYIDNIQNVYKVGYDPKTHERFCVRDNCKLEFCFDDLPDYQITNFGIRAVGVLYKPHIQQFIRALRDSLFYYYGKREKYFTYIVVGEYGTKQHRPHFHGVLHIDKWEIADHIKKLIPEIWLYCSKERITVKYLDGEQFGYLSSYVSGLRDSDGVLSTKYFREFHLYSKLPLYGVSRGENEILQGFADGTNNEPFRKISGQTPDSSSVLTLSKSVLRSYFPRFKGVDYLDDSVLFDIIYKDKRDYEYYRRLTLACIKFCRVFLHMTTDRLSSALIWLYLRVYRKVYTSLQSYLIKNVNEDIFRRVSFDSVVSFYLNHYNTLQCNIDLITDREYRLIKHYLRQFDLALEQNIPKFISEVRGLLPGSYFSAVDMYISKYRAMLSPKHASSYLNNF